MNKKELLNNINIDEIKRRPLSNEDISRCLYNDTSNKATVYKDLYNCNNIINLFDGDNKILLLLSIQSHSNGHWITLI